MSASITPQFIEELRNRVTLSSIIQQKVKLTKAGREYKGCCPFHKEKSPSFFVNDDKGFYHCFGCSAHGDAIKFLTEHEGRTFIEAIEMLAQMAGMQVPQETKAAQVKRSEQDEYYALMEKACAFFQHQLSLKSTKEIQDYLKQRGINGQLAKEFKLGYAPANSNLLKTHLTKAGYSDAQLLKSGLFKKPDDGRDVYAFFRDRLIFPVQDRRARVVAFGGRIMSGTGPKYLNSPESPIFNKGQLLYNAHRVLAHHKENPQLIVCEGYMDVIALYKAGYYGAVAPLGTALTDLQIKQAWQLSHHTNRDPILCFDGDHAGLNAGFRSLTRIFPILAPDRTIKIAFMPEGQDPDNLINANRLSDMQMIFDKARNLIDVLWLKHHFQKHFATPEAKAGLKAALYQDIDLIEDKTIQHLYKDEIWHRFSETYYKKSTQKFSKNNVQYLKKNSVSAPSTPLSPPKSGSKIREALILATLINYPELYKEFEDRLLNITFTNIDIMQLSQSLFVYLTDEDFEHISTQKIHALINANIELRETLTYLSSNKLYLHGNFAKPDQKLDDARMGLDELIGFIEHDKMQAEIARANLALQQEFTQENYDRFISLNDRES